MHDDTKKAKKEFKVCREKFHQASRQLNRCYGMHFEYQRHNPDYLKDGQSAASKRVLDCSKKVGELLAEANKCLAAHQKKFN